MFVECENHFNCAMVSACHYRRRFSRSGKDVESERESAIAISVNISPNGKIVRAGGRMKERLAPAEPPMPLMLPA